MHPRNERPSESAARRAHLTTGHEHLIAGHPHLTTGHGHLTTGHAHLTARHEHRGHAHSSAGRRARRRSPLAFLALVAVVALAPAILVGCGQPGPRLVLLLVVDTLRADRLGCYGDPEVATPNIDALAENGVVYENAMTAAPVTLPSMATILTGTYPLQHGIRDNGPYELASSSRTLGEVLQESGYATAAFVSASVLAPEHGLGQGFDVYDADVTMHYTAYDPLLVPTEDDIQGIERRAEVTVDRALAWLEGVPDRDAFLLVHLFDPHLPRDPPPPFAEQYPDRAYEGEIAYTDAEIGRLLAGIRKMRGSGEVVTVFVADHGEGLGDHGELLHGDLLFSSTVRVPLIVGGPGIPRGRRVPDLVRTADICATIAELTGTTAPEASVGVPLPGLGLDPQSHLDLSPRFATTAYLETFRPRLTHHWCELRGLRTERWKLIDGPRYELYDLERDPTEAIDVAAREPEVCDSLAALLDRIGLLAARRGTQRAGEFELDAEEAEKLLSLGYVTPRTSQLPPAPVDDAGGDATSAGADGGARASTGGGLSPDSLAVWLYPEAERGRALGLPHPAERLGATQDRIVARSFYASAVAEMALGHVAVAAQRFRAAFEKSPRFVEAYLGFAQAALAEGKKEAAFQCLQLARKHLPGDARIAAELAALLAGAGRTAEAGRVLDEAEAAGAPRRSLERVRKQLRR